MDEVACPTVSDAEVGSPSVTLVVAVSSPPHPVITKRIGGRRASRCIRIRTRGGIFVFIALYRHGGPGSRGPKRSLRGSAVNGSERSRAFLSMYRYDQVQVVNRSLLSVLLGGDAQGYAITRMRRKA